MVSKLLIKRKKIQNQKADIPKCAKHKREAMGLVWLQKLDNSLLIFLVIECLQAMAWKFKMFYDSEFVIFC